MCNYTYNKEASDFFIHFWFCLLPPFVLTARLMLLMVQSRVYPCVCDVCDAFSTLLHCKLGGPMNIRLTLASSLPCATIIDQMQRCHLFRFSKLHSLPSVLLDLVWTRNRLFFNCEASDNDNLTLEIQNSTVKSQTSGQWSVQSCRIRTKHLDLNSLF